MGTESVEVFGSFRELLVVLEFMDLVGVQIQILDFQVFGWWVDWL